MFRTDTKWIWINKQEEEDEYASFIEKFQSNGKKVILKIAAETNYIAYVNGHRAAFGQFPGYRNEKYYDEIDITEFSISGENELRVVVRYEGIDTHTHIKDKAGVIFEIIEEGEVLCHSCKKTFGGLDFDYQQHVRRLVTTQLGYSVNMSNQGETLYDTCREVDLPYHFRKRPVNKLVEEPVVHGKKLDISEKDIYDLGRESVGHIIFKVYCEENCNITLAYGEHLADGEVRKKIGDRDFSMDFSCRAGSNYFEQLFVRTAGRYIQIYKPENAVVESVAILPVMYPVEETERFLSGLDGKIYDTCVRTLRLCMHEHYEDCPWREQALYVLDSRNQMLCGYYAFNNTEYARANIVYMSKGLREDGLLTLTFPSANEYTIPFFSIMYPVIVWEYIEYTGDISILSEVMPAAKQIMETFRNFMGTEGLLYNCPAPCWNFYEWSEGSSECKTDGTPIVYYNNKRYDLILNCAFVYAGKKYIKLCEMCGEEFNVDLDMLRIGIQNFFYDDEKGMYFLNTEQRKIYSQLGNAFAKLIGLEGENLENAVRGEYGVVPVTLSMISFVYDALIDSGEENEKFVVQDIRKKYGYMLDNNATSFWETIKGDSEFEGAGSLCHGWSAMPVYYYHKLRKKNYFSS